MTCARFWCRLLVAMGCAIMALEEAHAQGGLSPAASLVDRPGVLIIAHRGDSRVAPENTLPAFASAVKAKADLVELDYHHTADGVPIVLHDGTLERTTDAKVKFGGDKIAVASKSLADLKRLDAGRWLSATFAGTQLPTLSEALDIIQAGSMTLIERKAGDPATCVRLLDEKGLLDRVVVQSFDWDYLAGCHRLAPGLMLAALGDKELTAERLDKIAQSGAAIVGWNEKSATPAAIAAIHARGMKAWVWTVDDESRIRQLVAAKANGIISNRPAVTRVIVEQALSGR